MERISGGGKTDRTPTLDGSSLPEVAWALLARDAKGADSSTKEGHLIPMLRGGSFDDVAGPLCTGTTPNGHGVAGVNAQHAASNHLVPAAFSCKDHGADAGEVAPTLRSMGHDGSHANGGGQIAIAFDTTQVTSPGNYSNPQPGDPCHPLAAEAHPPAVAIQDGREITKEQNGLGLNADGSAYTVDTTGAQAVSFQERGRDGGRSLEYQEDIAYSLNNPGEGGRAQERNILTPTHAVRRLTPLECERLQGFPDNYTAIPWGSKPASECPDGPRYKALGNSMACNVMSWLGWRIQAVEDALTPDPDPAATAPNSDLGADQFEIL